MRRGNRVGRPRSAPGAEMGPSTPRFAPLLSPEVSPKEPLAHRHHVTAHFWKAGPAPPLGQRVCSGAGGSAAGEGVELPSCTCCDKGIQWVPLCAEVPRRKEEGCRRRRVSGPGRGGGGCGYHGNVKGALRELTAVPWREDPTRTEC